MITSTEGTSSQKYIRCNLKSTVEDGENVTESETVNEVLTCKTLQELLIDKSPKDICDLLDEKAKLELFKYQLHQSFSELSNKSGILSVISNSDLKDNLMQQLLSDSNFNTKCKVVSSLISENNTVLKDVISVLDKEVKKEMYSTDFVSEPQFLDSVLRHPLVFKEILQNDDFVSSFFSNIKKEAKVTLTCNDISKDPSMLNNILQSCESPYVAESVSSTLISNSQFAESIVNKLDLETSASLMKLLSEKMYNIVASRN